MFTAEVHDNQVHLSAVLWLSGYDSCAINFFLALGFITHIMKAERQTVWQVIHMTSGVEPFSLVKLCFGKRIQTNKNVRFIRRGFGYGAC